jgi:guanylate kinase
VAGMIDGVDYIGEIVRTLERPGFEFQPSEEAFAPLADIDLRTTSGGSGTGKGTILAELQEITDVQGDPLYHRVVTWATRDMREGEVDGVGYNFLHKPNEHRTIYQAFQAGRLLQVVKKYGNLYGSFPEDFEAARGMLGLMDCVPAQAIDFRDFGFRSVVNVLIVPPDYETWMRRWLARNVEPEAVLKDRVRDTAYMHKTALEDGQTIFVPNEDLATAVKHVRQAFEDDSPNRAANNRGRDIAAKIAIRIFDDFGLSHEMSPEQRMEVMHEDDLAAMYAIAREVEEQDLARQ